MKVKGLDFVFILVKDMDKALEFFSKKLGIEFVTHHGPPDPKEMGLVVYVNFDCQIELVSPLIPLPKDAPALIKRWSKLLEDRDSQIVSLVFRVDHAGQLADDLEQEGIRVEAKIDSPEIKELSLRNLEERIMVEEDTLGISMQFVSYELV